MKSILKCIYVILFLILIASSSALFILVASESMQNIQKTSNREIKGQELNTKENLLRENLVESESVSCDKEDSKINKNFPTNSDESSDVLNGNVVKIGEEINYLGPDETINSPEILHKQETVDSDGVNEPYRTQLNVLDSNIKIEINTTTKHTKSNTVSSSFEEKKMNSFINLDESYNDPPIARDIPPDKMDQNIIDEDESLVIAPIISEEHQSTLEESTTLSEDIKTKKSETTLKQNITEEKPIPVFSEWAQKQMEEAEKKLEKDAGNTSSMKKNITNGNKPAPNLLKLRVKNYASPDCGAKIITSNFEAQNTGALLTSSKDEYMLSPCTSRIWFVVELCEAIQAKQIDFANFELFSSSPKNFTVSVSNRFPTRDWSNVGRFIAEDTRNIQSFDLFPHLFGKYVRVDVHSHYNSEHFCPISLLRVYGTSEFEAFDSENRNPYEDIDDVDDDIVQVEINKKEDNNLFKSASDAVMSIVKKAAQVLTKEKPNRIEFHEDNNILCFTPIIKRFECSNCSQITIDNVNYVLSCKFKELIQLLSIRIILDHLIRSEICFDTFGVDVSFSRKLYFQNLSKNLSISPNLHKSLNLKDSKYKKTNLQFHDELNENFFHENEYLIDEKESYYLNSINLDYLGAMCHILKYQTLADFNFDKNLLNFSNRETPLNITVEKVVHEQNHISNEKIDEEINHDYNEQQEIEKNSDKIVSENGNKVENSNEISSNEIRISLENPKESNIEMVNTIDDTSSEISDSTVLEGVNIFNLIDDSIPEEDNLETYSEDISKEKSDPSEYKLQLKSEEIHESTTTPIPSIIPSKIKNDDDSQWETEERLFNEHLTNDINLNINSVGSNLVANQHKSTQHTESVFTRLSNRIKALERNMSLSGQYLEELSRRYKKQVEELQTSFSKTLTAIEDQNRRFTELELLLQKQNTALQSNLDELNVKLHFWMFVLIIVTTIGLIYILTSFYSVTLIGRRQKSLYKKFEESNSNRKENEKLKRRKSTDGVSRNSNLANKKIRRPSEEAMKINGSYKDLMIDDQNMRSDNSIENINSCEEYENYSENSNCNNRIKSNVRNRKLSICYSKDNQPIIKKHSLPIICNNNILEQNYKEFNKFSKIFYDASNKMNGQSNNSSDNNYCDELENETIPEELIVVDDETDQISSCNSGYEYISNKNNDEKSKNNIEKLKKLNNNNNNNKPKKSDTSVKIRRLSSPSFLKSPFNKKTTTESTGWEWIRNGSNKNRQKKITIQDNSNNKEYFKYVLNNSLDSERDIIVERNPSPNSTVSEQIIFHNSINNSENDSLRTTNSEDSSLQASIEGTSSSLQHNMPESSSSAAATNKENNDRY
ncbi:SUN domain-containing ossification factor isoform X2 [Condylostylus longicornis]|uniref:SUN domain-containing ossification factor isoform X2 n=1 Tax=Condylostylus longicornis TaxID=2530218 RepID=UPI00244DE6D3|nr:SUN domain-containing ossification factor isoform X2 [Condylostylus longicornis]